jgi:hypothetical protein
MVTKTRDGSAQKPPVMGQPKPPAAKAFAKAAKRVRHKFMTPYDMITHDGPISVKTAIGCGHNSVVVDVTNVDMQTARMIGGLHDIAELEGDAAKTAVSMKTGIALGQNSLVVDVTGVKMRIAKILTGLIRCVATLESSFTAPSPPAPEGETVQKP